MDDVLDFSSKRGLLLPISTCGSAGWDTCAWMSVQVFESQFAIQKKESLYFYLNSVYDSGWSWLRAFSH